MGAGRIGVKLRGAGAQAAPGVEDSADGLLPEKGKYTLQQTTVGLLSTSGTGSVLQTLYRHPHPMQRPPHGPPKHCMRTGTCG